MTAVTRTQVVGAGPAGLLLGRLLDLAGIEKIVVEARSRRYGEERLRAGVLESPSPRCWTSPSPRCAALWPHPCVTATGSWLAGWLAGW